MSLCCCDGPPHTYDPSWCVSGLKRVGGSPMRPAAPAGRDTLRAPRGSDRALRYAAIRRLDDGSEGAKAALRTLGVTDDEFDRW